MTEPLFWHVDLVAELPSLYGPGAHFLIDLMPNNSSELALYELLDAWGHSENSWTPAMFRLRGLIVDGDKSELRGEPSHLTTMTSTRPSTLSCTSMALSDRELFMVLGHLREPVRPTPPCFGQRRSVTLSRPFACLRRRFWVTPNTDRRATSESI